MRTYTRVVGVLSVLSVLLAGGLARAADAGLPQRPGDEVRPPVDRPFSGQEAFASYCAPCHGRDGRGNGPVAASLKTPPSDLTTLTKRHGGVFPQERVEDYITKGSLVPAHGSTDMPVWGPIFLWIESSQNLAEFRIAKVVAHIESIQRR